MDKYYNPTNWKNLPTKTTPLSAQNLNHLEDGVDELDDRIVQLDADKADSNDPTFTGTITADTMTANEVIANGVPLSNRAPLDEPSFTGNVGASGDYTNGDGDTLHGVAQMLKNILPVDAESGNPCVITDAFGDDALACKVTIVPKQSGSGTPSPDNVRPISGSTELNIVRTGRNMLPLISASGSSGITITPILSGETIIGYDLDGTATAEVTKYITDNNIGLPSMTYYLSTGLSAEVTGLQMVVAPSYTGVKTSGTLTGTVRNIYLNIKNGTVLNHVKVYPFVCPNSFEDKTFEPYNGDTETVSLGGTVYGGEAEVVSGEGSSNWKLIDLGDLTWVYNSQYTRFEATISDMVSKSASRTLKFACSCYQCIDDGRAIADVPNYSAYSYLTTMNVVDNRYTDADAFKTTVTGQKLAYPSTDETALSLTPTTITLLNGDNVVSVDAESVEVTYRADIAKYIDKKLAEGSNNRNLAKGGGGSDEPVIIETKGEVKDELTR